MTTPTVKFGGEILGGDFLYGWIFSSGVSPVDRIYNVTKDRAEKIKAFLGSPQLLDTTSPGRPDSAWDFIYALEIKAGSDPFMRRVRLSDRRWLWPKRWVSITMNKRRATGDTFLVGGGRSENQILLERLRYAEYSLFPPSNPSEVWTAKSAITHVLVNELGTPVIFKDEPPTQVEIQDLIIDDQGADAVARIMAYLPGMNLYIDRAGQAVIYDTQSGDELSILEAAPPAQTGGGTVEVVDKRALRPSKVVVLFSAEVEQRFDYAEPASGVTQTRTDDTPVLEAVLFSPDLLTTLADGTLATRGSVIKQQDAFTAWGAFGAFNKAVSFDVLRKHATGYGFGTFMQAWGNDYKKPSNPINTARATAAMGSWRSDFQIERIYIGRLESVRAYRASILSAERGIYAPSEVFTDWTRRPGFYGLAKGLDGNTGHGWAVRGYPEDDLLDSARAAPAKVEVKDDGSGLVRIEPRLDAFGFNQSQWFGFPDDGFLPDQDAGRGKLSGLALYRHWPAIVFEAGWKMAVVLTVVPGSPNTLDRFYQVEVSPDQIKPDVGQSDGPVVYVRVFPGVMTARFGHLDENADEITAVVKGEAPYDTISDLLLNEDFVNNVALAAATRVYEPLRDRPIGSMSVDWRPEIEPGGSLGVVEHRMSGGALITRATFSAVQQPLDIWRYMNSSTRRAVLMVLANQGSAG